MSFNLNTTLIQFANDGVACDWTLGDAVQGVQIFGGTGSGKTSGSGRMLALKYLSAGFGGLVLTVKPDEKDLWKEYCELAGRTDDLLIIQPNGEHAFDFLEYESRDKEDVTENLVQVLKTVIQASEQQAGTGSSDPFWETSLDMLIFNVIDLCMLAYGSVSVQRMYDISQTLPQPEHMKGDEKPETAFYHAFLLAQEKVSGLVDAWKAAQEPDELAHLQEMPDIDDVLCANIPEARTLKFIDQFFFDGYLNLSEKTRSVIDFSFSGFLFRLLRDPVYSLFCKQSTTFTPEDSLDGKIILIDLPVKLHHKIGRDCQIMFKYIWQRAMEKRDVGANGRPVFLWADEAQNFIHEHDTDYQATARSSRIATVYITQNLANYHANMGGVKSDMRVKSFLGTLGTKIFHANADVETNRYASELIGDAYHEETSKTSSFAGRFSFSRTRSMRIDRVVRPETFMRLKTGGERNQGRVDGYIHIQGNPIGHLKVRFAQNYTVNP